MHVYKKSLFLFSCLLYVGSVVAEDEPAEPRSLSEATISRLMDEMVWVEGGSFIMGSDSNQASKSEGPAHPVTLDGFYIGKYEVSQQLFQEVMRWETIAGL